MTSSLELGQGARPVGVRAAARRAPRRRQWLPAALLLLPSLVFLAAFTYWPVLYVTAESFLVGRFAGEHAIGPDNYRR